MIQILGMEAEFAAQPDDVDALKAALLAARADVARSPRVGGPRRTDTEKSSNLALIAHLKLQIEKLNRDRFGPRSERTARLLDQMELQLEELEASATEDELTAETAAAQVADTTTGSASLARRQSHPHRGSPSQPPRRSATVALGRIPGQRRRSSSLTMAATRYVYTIARVARMLGEDEALLAEIAADMDPEDGCLSVFDLNDDVSTTAFTAFGVENLKELLTDLKPERPPA